jgi:hypothetical protein
LRGTRLVKEQIFDNGGTKVCHGVAQTALGTDFSFLLDLGNDKPSVKPVTIHYDAPGNILSKPTSSKHYLIA